MADTVTRKCRSEIMSNIRAKGMKPEMTVRRIAHAMGYRLHRKDLPGKPDLVFPGRRKAIFVHGCFWHQHSDPACKIARRPQSNRDSWLPKLKRTVARDAEQQARLANLGWTGLVIWECGIKAGDGIAERIREFLDHRQDEMLGEGRNHRDEKNDPSRPGIPSLAQETGIRMKAAGSLEPSAPSLSASHWRVSGAEHGLQGIGGRTGTLHFAIHDALNQAENLQ